MKTKFKSIDNRRIYKRYIDVIKLYGETYPEYLYVSGAFVLTRERFASFGNYLKTMKRIAKYFINTKRPNFEFPHCDVIIFHHWVKKPHIWPLFGDLAKQLARKGFTCALINSTEMKILECMESGDVSIKKIPDFRHWVNHGFTYIQALSKLARSFGMVWILFWRALFIDKVIFTKVLYDVPGVWLRLLMSSHHYDLANALIPRLGSRLIVVDNHRTVLGGELYSSMEAKHLYKILFDHDLPYPPFKSYPFDEILVKNSVVEQEWANLFRGTPDEDFKSRWTGFTQDDWLRISKCSHHPKLTIAGVPEVDYAWKKTEAISKAEYSLKEKTNGKKVILYPSVYGNQPKDSIEYIVTEKSILWLSVVLEKYPDWLLVFKPRPQLKGDIYVPGSKYIEEFDNFTVAPDGISYGQLLKWDNLRAVSSYGTSALFIAAGAGVSAIQICIPDVSLWPTRKYISDVCVNVHSCEELESIIKDINVGQNMRTAPDKNNFPYYGRTVNRIENICIARLSEINN